MIVIFEGPRLVGKTTLIDRLEKTLNNWEVPVQKWKDIRGEDPISDMNAVLDEGIFTNDQLWLVDRFHFSEWVISKATRRAAYPGSEWAFFEAGLQKVDERLEEMQALIVLVTTSPWLVDQRAQKTGKKDPIGDSQKAQYWFTNTIGKTSCDMIHVINDRTRQLDRLTAFLADILYVRWNRQKPSTSELVEIAVKELGAEVKEIEDEDRDAPLGPRTVESDTELSGGSDMDDESMDVPF